MFSPTTSASSALEVFHYNALHKFMFTITITITRVHPLTEFTIPAFAFPAEAGTHLPTPEGWKAELTLMA